MLKLDASPLGPLDTHEEELRQLSTGYPQFWGIGAPLRGGGPVPIRKLGGPQRFGGIFSPEVTVPGQLGSQSALGICNCTLSLREEKREEGRLGFGRAMCLGGSFTWTSCAFNRHPPVAAPA